MDYHQLFADNIRGFKVGQNNQATGICPFHNDKHPSFSVNTDTGLWNCKTPSCGVKGNAYQFAKRIEIDPTPYQSFINNNYQQCDIKEMAERFKDYLITHFNDLKDKEKIPAIWTVEAIEQTCTGYDKTKDCITFTHCDLSSQPINIKYHKFGKDQQTTQQGQSKAKLFPLNLIPKYDKYQSIVYCEGEKDCITLLSVGINAVTGTTGAGSIPKDLTSLKDLQQIYIVYDNDPTGYDGAENLARKLKNTFSEQKVYTYEWHIKTVLGFDVTDYFLNGGIANGFKHMMDYATQYHDTYISDESYIKLYRKSIYSRVFADPFLNQLWTWCLLKASHKRTVVNAKCGRGNKQISLLQGQFLFNSARAERELRQPKSTTRDRLKKLVNMGNIRIEKVNDRTLITICKWMIYQ